MEDDSIKALSIKQPWAHLIAQGYKDIENRTWSTSYRGWFYVHTGQEPDRERYERAAYILEKVHNEQLPPLEEMRTGGIVGMARLVDVRQFHTSPWHEGPYGFVLEDAIPVPFRECKGPSKFFEPDLDFSNLDAPAAGCPDETKPRRPY